MSNFTAVMSILVAYIVGWMVIERTRWSQLKKTIVFSLVSAACLVGVCFVAAQSTNAQEDALAPAAVVTTDVPVGAFAAIPDDATLSVKAFRDEVAKGIVQAAEESTKLTRLQKGRVARVMRGGWFNDSRRERIIDMTVEKLHADQQVVVLPDGVAAAVDWDAVFAFIEKLIPLIMTFITLFGG